MWTIRLRQPWVKVAEARIGGFVTEIDDTSRYPDSSGVKTSVGQPPVRQVTGHVIGAEAADINADGSPEIYAYVEAVSGEPGTSLVAYSANRRRSLSEIYLPPVTDDARAALGYRGRDEMRVVEGTFVRRFPIYRQGDADAKPTGGTRQIQYKLALGEASWVLRIDSIVE